MRWKFCARQDARPLFRQNPIHSLRLEITALLPEIDAALASLDDYSATVLGSPAASSLKIIARWGVGYDAIDIPAATRQGIVVTYTPGQLDDSVADYTFALLLCWRGGCMRGTPRCGMAVGRLNGATMLPARRSG